MGYIHLFGEKLDALLATRGVGEADREIIAYVKHIVLESYQNGRAARGGGKKPPTDRRPRREK